MRVTDGNITQNGEHTYTCDAYTCDAYTCDTENRLICVAPTSPQAGQKKVESVYDYMGRRVQKTVTAWDGSIGTGGDWATAPLTVTHFVYDGWNLVLELNGLATDNPATAYDDTISRKYTWGLDLSGLSGNASVSGIHGAGGIGGLLATAVMAGSSSTDHVYFYDGNGNVGQTLGLANDTFTARYEYDPYGNFVSILGTPFRNGNPFRFSTKYFDKELDLHGTNDGLYYYGYRFYSPRLGRWLTRDPIGYADGGNAYGHVQNSPVRHIDSLGLMTTPWPRGGLPCQAGTPPTTTASTSQPTGSPFSGAGTAEDPRDLSGLLDILQDSGDPGCGVCVQINPRGVKLDLTIHVTRVNDGCTKTKKELEKNLSSLAGLAKLKFWFTGFEEKCNAGCKCENKKDLPRQYSIINIDRKGAFLEYKLTPPYYIEGGCTGDLRITAKMTLDGWYGECKKEPEKDCEKKEKAS